MAESALQSIFRDGEASLQAFDSAKSRAKKTDVSDTYQSGILFRLVGKVDATFPPDATIDILSVRNVFEEIDLDIAAAIKSCFKAVNLTVLAHTEQHAERYRDLIQEKRSDLLGVDINIRSGSVEDVVGGTKETKYHVIVALHGMYQSEDYNADLGRLYHALVDDGVLMVVTFTGGAFWGVWKRVSPYHDRQATHYINAKHIRDSLAMRAIPFETSEISTLFDITYCFDEKNDDEDVNKLVDFLTLTADFKDVASPQLYKRIIEFVTNGPFTRKRPNGTVLLRNVSEALFVQKPVRPQPRSRDEQMEGRFKRFLTSLK
ncbi:histamine N-methyltransferase-like [Diadema setosum]|uniref:histamine N-methyltransferase-like n=1 Tax=Diadema setosum TaxID=31175 RepID=UPI003B3B7CA6